MGEGLHDGQKRLSGEPYFTHPVAVAKVLAEMGADTDTLIAALLHDTIEDTPATLKDINDAFDGQVASLIEGVTKLYATDLPEKSKLNEQIETLRKMFTLMERDVRIMVIKLADRLHNIRTGSFLPEEKRRVLAQETLDVYVKIADRLCMQDLRDELQDRCLAIVNPNLHARLTQLREENARKSEDVMPGMEALLRRLHPQLMVRTKVKTEPKSWDKLLAQHEAKGAVVSGLSSVTVVFLCADREACYRILGALHQSWQREALSFQDYINSPVANGYQGVHTTIILADGTRIRCKIRTQDMDEYYHRGVTMFCFQPQTSESLQSLLPWTKRISTVAEETKERSLEFWESLQNDILGETITVHGPYDQAVQIPRGATALDAAFYLFQENALYAETLKMNGKDVALGTPLQNAISLDVSFSPLMTVRREWLTDVHTRLSVAMIRAALTEHSEEERNREGREVLQRLLTENGRGYLEEFDAEALARRLQPLGFHSLEEACIAIADGHADANEVFQLLFEPTTTVKSRDITIRYGANLRDTEMFDGLNRVHRMHASQLKNLRYIWTPGNRDDAVILKVSVTDEERDVLLREIEQAGGKHVESIVRTKKELGLIGLVILLWGLDPVIARFLILHDSLTPVDFTLLRFWSLAIVSVAIAAIRRRGSILQRLRLLHPLLWVSAALLALVALTTYAALQGGTATHYEILMASSALLIATALRSIQEKRAVFLWLLFGCLLLLLTYSPAWHPESGLFMLLSLLSFAAFLGISNRYLRQEFIARRRFDYYTAMLVIGSVVTLPLAFFASPALFNPVTILDTSLFSIVFIGLPYYLYYERSSKQEASSVIPFAFIMLTVTAIGELALTRQLDPFTFLAFLASILLSFFLERHWRY